MKTATLKITRELFIETIGKIKEQYEHDNKCNKALNVVFPDDFISGYQNHLLINQLIKLLQISMDDEHAHSWIEYFINELDFGDKYTDGCASNADGSNIDLSDAGKLYDFLIIN